ncbi:MAG TPA: YciI family protein [Candidatus Dormibacteraeota bacterium]|nr:YciI family protein [Candidatus Dormibacteraeota bacterium]
MRYMLLIYGPEPTMASEGATPDIEPWNEYTRWLVERGTYRGGEPLADSSTATSVRVRDGRPLVTDGPFAETKEVLGGYYVLECDDLDAALDAAARCPGAAYGTIEVRPLLSMPGLEAG